MALERTLCIIKPDALKRNLIGAVSKVIEEQGFAIIAAKMVRLNHERAAAFYAVHKSMPFFDSLVNYMSSGPVVVQVLEGENVILGYRRLMGATDPSKAQAGTLRNLFADSSNDRLQLIRENIVHGSDSDITATKEIDFFFNEVEIYSKVES